MRRTAFLFSSMAGGFVCDGFVSFSFECDLSREKSGGDALFVFVLFTSLWSSARSGKRGFMSLFDIRLELGGDVLWRCRILYTLDQGTQGLRLKQIRRLDGFGYFYIGL